jgi:D-lactate dehydrogenase
MKISFFDMKDKGEIDFIKQQLKGFQCKFFDKSISEVPLKEFKDTEILVVFIYSPVSKEIIDSLPKLRCILTQSTGYDHIDITYAKSKGIGVGNVPFYGENTVAEHCFGLILSLSRKIHKNYMRVLSGNYSLDGLRGFDLKGKTLGVIGVGHIGLHVIKIARGFGMNVLAYDVKKDSFLSEVMHFSYASLDEVLSKSDIISLHMPLLPQTKHFISEKELKQTKKGCIIINTARGGLIDTKALYKYLKNGHLGGAGLDVIEGEEYISHEDELLSSDSKQNEIFQIMTDEKIFKMENVIFTPHNAFNSQEAIERILCSTCENIKYFKEKHMPKYII